MRIVIDLDGTICELKEPGQTYMDVLPKPGAAEKIRDLRLAGHYIIIQTARNMATRDGNVGQVLRHVAKITLDWLEKFNIEYDEIYFGKPNGHIYIDDRAYRFLNWDNVTNQLIDDLGRTK